MISPKHANFIENAGGATTADALALMAEARRRAREQFGVELEHEVELLGEIELPLNRRKRRCHGETRERGRRQRITESPAPASACGDCRLAFHAARAGGRLELAKIAPSGRSLLIGLADPADGARSLRRRAWDLGVRGSERRRRGRLARGRRARFGSAGAGARREPARARPRRRSSTAPSSVPMVARRVVRPRPSRTRCGSRSSPRCRSPSSARDPRRGSPPTAAASSPSSTGARSPGLPRIWLKRDVDVRLGERVGGMQLRAVAAVAPLVSKPLPLGVASAVATRGRADARPPQRARAPARRQPRPAGEARGRAARDPTARRGRGLPRRERSRAAGRRRDSQLSG